MWDTLRWGRLLFCAALASCLAPLACGDDDDSGEDAGPVYAEGEPGPDEAWVYLKVNCAVAACEDKLRTLTLAGCPGTESCSGAPEYAFMFNDVTFPFETMLSKGSALFEQGQKLFPIDWSEGTFTFVSYYISIDAIPPMPKEGVDPKSDAVTISVAKGKVTVLEIDLTL